MPNPTISVIITSYNRADYLREAVDSIIGQSFKDFEIIIVDDGSTDNAPQVAAEYANQYDFISFIAQENAGVAAARTVAAKKAKGKYITFQDDDDTSHPDRLLLQTKILDTDPNITACVSNYAPIGSKIKRFSPMAKSKWLWQGVGASMMIYRDVYLLMGGQRSYFHASVDFDFFLRFDEKYNYHYINEVLYYYRFYNLKGSNNLTNIAPLRRFDYVAAAYISAHCRRSNLPDPIEKNIKLEDLIPQMASISIEVRQRLLRLARNTGRRLLAIDKASNENMRKVNEYIDLLGHGECFQQAKKYRRWLALQSLRYGKFKHIKLFLL